MEVVDNAEVIGRTIGEKDVYLIHDLATGAICSYVNSDGLDIELGMEGKLTYKNVSENEIVSFEIFQ
ncbi:MAG: hypothetical protein Q8907_15450 [Bacteroidota bacterium]|nr:hypothetical protein [Bacteroidota bacterium]MDP4275666.1 hypothetical protein [Bacteroidota bacterium]